MGMESKWSESLKQKAGNLSEEFIGIRRQIHQNPELGFKEEKTAQLICEKLKNLGIRFRAGVGKTGVVGIIEGTGKGKTVGLRADMDAVPVWEEANVPYASKNPGVMHACGHDAHVACVLGAAVLLVSLSNQFKGRVKLVFQPAEEIDLGAKAMMEEGVLESPRPDAFFALHVDPDLLHGTVGVREGPLMAAIDTIRISVSGKGGHIAMPHRCVDAIVAASALVMNLQTSVSRNTDPIKPIVVSIGTFNAGQSENNIASRADLTGTVRTLDLDVHRTIPEIIERICRNTAATFGAGISMEYQRMLPPLVNSKQMAAIVAESCEALLGHESVIEAPISMGGDDFAFFLKEVPGCYIRLGTKNASSDMIHSLHNGLFDLDEQSLHLGAALLAHTALIALER
jgi:amidohydrolase